MYMGNKVGCTAEVGFGWHVMVRGKWVGCLMHISVCLIHEI